MVGYVTLDHGMKVRILLPELSAGGQATLLAPDKSKTVLDWVLKDPSWKSLDKSGFFRTVPCLLQKNVII